MNVGETWLKGDWNAGRGAIYRALKIDAAQPGALYATLPFRILREGDAIYIAGAVGLFRAFSPADWSPDLISDVILWNPRTQEVRLLGDIGAALVLPRSTEPRVTVYADGFAFFRAWADQRAATFARLMLAHANHRVALAEPTDSDIPGALVIGNLADVQWRETGASVLVAGPGVDGRKLNAAVIRSARLPRVESLAA